MTTGREHSSDPSDSQAASTGIRGLDEILRGGLPRDEMHLVEGAAGTGKTTLALQFLLAGVRAGESGLYITLSQTKRGLEEIARSHGWSLQGITVHELSPGAVAERIAAHQTVLHTAEVELDELTQELREEIEQTKPRRVVFDSLGVVGLLAGSAPRYHREIVTLRRFLAGHGCTALLVGDRLGPEEPEDSAGNALYALATSVIHLAQRMPDYGEVRRRVLVIKVRSVSFQSGYHDFRILTGGLEVYPRLGAPTSPEYTDFLDVRSGIEPLDRLLGGGLQQGTACLLVGPPGSGKSTLASVFARHAAGEGTSSSIFLFDERPEIFKKRAQGVGVDLQPQLDQGRIVIYPMDTASITPGEFAERVRREVLDRQVKIVVIDSLTGYFSAMESTTMLVVQMHELLNFLSRHGVLTMLLISQEGFMTVGAIPSLDVSYLSDSIIVVQMFEADGSVRRCLSAVKKRQGEHETSIRELFIRPGQVTVGEEPLRQFRRILIRNSGPVGEVDKASEGDEGNRG
jgi:circadian clock protein KaiC